MYAMRIVIVVAVGAFAIVAAARAGVGSISLIDASGLEFFINTDVTFATSFSASGAAMDATYTTVVAATTSGGGTAVGILSNAFNGYNNLFINGVGYNMNGPAELECDGRQVVFPEQTIGNLVVQRKVFVPEDDSYCRWLNFIRNSGAAPIQVTVTIVNQLGSGTDTIVAQTSTPPAVPTTIDEWVITFQDYAAGVSPAPRLGHILQGPGRSLSLSSINFADGNDMPFWEYAFSIPSGNTFAIMNVVTGQPSIAAAAAQCAALAGDGDRLVTCLSDTERGQVKNFDVVAPTVSLSSSTANPTNTVPIPVSVTFSEPVTGFDAGDITVVNAVLSDFSGSEASYSFELTPNADGEVRAEVPAGVAEDAAGNSSTAAASLRRTVDRVGPTVSMTSTTRNPSNVSTVIKVTANFSDNVNGFTASDIVVSNASLRNFASAAKTYSSYTFELLPLRLYGTVTAQIPAGVATDDAGNPNSAAAPFQHTVGPFFSCLPSGAAKGRDVPLHAGLTDLVPIALASLVALRHRFRYIGRLLK